MNVFCDAKDRFYNTAEYEPFFCCLRGEKNERSGQGLEMRILQKQVLNCEKCRLKA